VTPGVSLERTFVLVLGLPLLLVLLWFSARRVPEGSTSRARRLLLAGLRGIGLVILLVLLARPYVLDAESGRERRGVVLLVDKSRSMALKEEGEPRFDRAIRLARELQPALGRDGFKVEVLAFDAATRPLDLSRPEATGSFGGTTDLAGALLTAALRSDPPPIALVALTDGAANKSEANSPALQALLESRTPVIAVGFGSDTGVRSLSLRRLSAPPRVPPRQGFRVSAHLEATGGAPPAFDLLLMRDGVVVQSRRVTADTQPSGRTWTEGFDVLESEEGLREFAVQLRLSPGEAVVSANTRGRAPVLVGQDKEFRVLYVQGALTWDFKFISRALRTDPALRVTGLSRTSRQSVFRQNVETAEELASGFPENITEIAPYRVLVLSGLKTSELSPAQQELVARFTSELGGGVLMIGGPASFDESWRGSRLEELLPVTLDQGGVVGLDKPFHLELSDEARRSPVFTVTSDGSSGKVWGSLPAFSGYGRVAEEKPGATVWARHDHDSGPKGKRILMASQHYGAGLAAVITVQNLWRWRLAKESDPLAFDRFWQQLLRYLGQSGDSEFAVQLLDQELRPRADIRCLVERRPRPESRQAGGAAERAERRVRVRDPRKSLVLDQRVALEPLRPVEIRFRAEQAGLYTITVEDDSGATLASQAVEIPETDLEMERTARDMENLRQWATASQGIALPVEDVGDPAGLAREVKARVEALSSGERPRPAGINGGVLALLLLGVAGEWALRRLWGLR
jgi:uncharacterized membrane protein